MQAYRAGDARAFERLVARHEKPVWNFLRRFVADATTAEDLLQEVFLRVVKSADEWRGAAKFSTWLYTIARNLSVDHARRAVHRNAASLDGPEHAGARRRRRRCTIGSPRPIAAPTRWPPIARRGAASTRRSPRCPPISARCS